MSGLCTKDFCIHRHIRNFKRCSCKKINATGHIRFVLQHDYTAGHPLNQQSPQCLDMSGVFAKRLLCRRSRTNVRAPAMPTTRYDATVHQPMRA